MYRIFAIPEGNKFNCSFLLEFHRHVTWLNVVFDLCSIGVAKDFKYKFDKGLDNSDDLFNRTLAHFCDTSILPQY